jgi:hypothetical protein
MAHFGSGSPFCGHVSGVSDFSFDSLVPPPFFEERTDCRTRRAPLSLRHPSDAGEALIVVGQAAGLPIVHDQMQVGATLRRGQVHGVGEVVSDIEGHPGARRHPAVPLLSRSTDLDLVTRKSRYRTASSKCENS